jgi:hypothetical protein
LASMWLVVFITAIQESFEFAKTIIVVRSFIRFHLNRM